MEFVATEFSHSSPSPRSFGVTSDADDNAADFASITFVFVEKHGWYNRCEDGTVSLLFTTSNRNSFRLSSIDRRLFNEGAARGVISREISTLEEDRLHYAPFGAYFKEPLIDVVVGLGEEGSNRIVAEILMEIEHLRDEEALKPAAAAAEWAVEAMVSWKEAVYWRSEMCVICRDAIRLRLRGKLAARMPCQHLFHGDCIREWLKRSNTCPVCRFGLPKQSSGRSCGC